nr:hypothetical protein [Tanacetum cinerariifolium]
MDVTVEQWLDLIYGDHKKVDVKVKEDVEIPMISSISCDKKEEDESDNGDLDVYEPQVCYDQNEGIYAEAVIFVNKRLVRLMDVTVKQWLDLIYGDHKKTIDRYTKNALWIYWTRGDDEVEHTDEEFSDHDDENLIDKDEVAEIFRIKTDIFDFETPICKAFDKFNYVSKLIPIYLLEISLDSRHMMSLKMNGWTNGTKEYHGLLRNHGQEMEFSLMIFVIFASLFVSRIGKLNGPLATQMMKTSATRDGWSDEEDIHEEGKPNDDHGIGNLDYDLVWDNASYHANHEEYEEDRCKLLGNPHQELAKLE